MSKESVINQERPSDAQAIIQMVERLSQPTQIQLEEDEQGRPRVVALPRGLVIHSLKPFEDERRSAPERREGTATHTTLESFCAGVERFADEDSALFADDNPRAPRLLAVFDYHEGNRRNDDGIVVSFGAPRFGRHRAAYSFPVSPEWQAWTRIGERELSQRELCEFLEEHVVDVIDPARLEEESVDKTKALVGQLGITLASPSQVITLARGLEIKVDTKIIQTVNLSSGESEFTFEETHRDKSGAAVRVHRGFAVHIPVFRGGDAYVLVVRLTYRKRNEGIAFKLTLQRADQAFRDAFEEAATVAQDRTGVPLFYGSPEG